MKFKVSKKLLVVLLLIAVIAALYFIIRPKSKIDYNTQVKPILNKKCISCHGGVKQQGGFSLLFREEALAKTKSGKYGIVPGNASKSEMIKRVKETDPEERMPYKHEALSKEEINILERWVKQGAEWGTHWAYIPVEKPEVPDYSDKWIKNNVDQYVFEKLKIEKLTPSVEADKPTLLRRVSLDLTGLPPDSIIAKSFLNDNSNTAYEKLVDALLASPAYAERWTSMWLDVARYADTKGYESDQERSIWKYRDWLIDAFNNDKPYNDFLIEQLAGDLMPNPDDAKYIATAFHRNSLTNDEGGTDNEEFRTAAVLDRVNTTWSGLMGTTFNCVQCHSHPYDPFKHDEYYKFMAFFNNTRDEDTEPDYPLLHQYTKEKDSARFAQLMDWLNKNVTPEEKNEQYFFLKTWQPVINSLQCDSFVNAVNTGWMAEIRNYGRARLKDVMLPATGEFTVEYVCIHNNGFLEVYIDDLNSKPIQRVKTINTIHGWEFGTATFNAPPGKHNVYLKYVNPTIPANHPNGILMQWFRFAKEFPGKDKAGYASAKILFDSLLLRSKPETTPIMMENPDGMKRTSHVFERGNWLVKGKEVAADVPHIMNAFPEGAAKNRLGLALWLTDKKNPLVARTMMNRLWEQLFGAGIAETLEDLGTQGITPTHKELLDYLSYKFMNDDSWSIKKALKDIVMSATYRQDSKTNEELTKKDPNNKLYARGPRIRLTSEQLRDQSLYVSGLLSNKMYGKPVMPFQPEGIWHSPYNDSKWKMSEGEDMYRRGLYTYWKRTAPYPSMITFDAAQRTVCVTRRIKTNTPLQALTTLNDSAFIVMARNFALQMRSTDNSHVNAQIADGYEAMMFKPITENKLKALTSLYDKSFQEYKKDELAISKMMGDKTKKYLPEDAAMVVVANAMLNLDEWVNKN
jgi:mono/diheme cytochrome c family protein